RPLPSEPELRYRYAASRNTIRDAVKWLATRSLVVTRPGQGTFVIPEIDPLVTVLASDVGHGPCAERTAYASEIKARGRSRAPDVSMPRVQIEQADDLVAGELGVPKGANVVWRHQERFIDGMPWSLQSSCYPMRLVEQGALGLIQANDLEDG